MTKLYAYQEKAVRKIRHFGGRALLADEMGLGKTLEALEWLRQHPKNRPAVVVCPASLKWVWEAEAMKHIRVRARILDGRKPPPTESYNGDSIFVINYDILPGWLEWLQKTNPQVLIADECQYIKSNRAQRSRAVKKLASRIPHVIAISGTPLTNRPSELWNTLNLIRPDIYSSRFSYLWRYCKPQRKPWGWEYKGAENLNELHSQLNRLMMVRNLKKDVLKELPEKIRSVIPLEIERWEEYLDAKDNFITWLTKNSAAKANRAIKAERLVQMGYLKRLAAELKMKAILQWVDDFFEENDGKLVVYCHHKAIISMMREKYPNISVVVDGSVTHRKRQLAVQGFQTNKRIRLFIGNIQAAGVGITLTAASVLAFAEIDWVPASMVQAEDRIHRIGQSDTSLIYYLVARGTIEEDLCRIIQTKQRVLDKTLDGGKVRNGLDVYDQLEQTLLTGERK